MSAKPEILFLAHRIPYPPNKGDKIRSWRLFKHLTERYSVHLAAFVDEERDFAHRIKLEAMAGSITLVRLNPNYAGMHSLSALAADEPLTFRYFRNGEMERAVAALRQRPLAAEIAFSSSMAPYIEKPMGDRLRIVDFCDADSAKWLQYADDANGPITWLYRREGKLLAEAEKRIAHWADASFAVSAEEAALFNQGEEAIVDWWPNGVDAGYFDPEASFKKIPNACDVVFTGAMDYRANVEAVLDFVTNSWPLVRARAPNASFAVAGANPVSRIRALDGKDGIHVTGRVADMRPWLHQAKLVVAPLRIARGVQNKVLEAMAMGKPVVATPAAAKGIDGAKEVSIIADTPDEIANAIADLLNDPGKRSGIGEKARAHVQAHYTWGEGLARFDAAIDRLAPRAAVQPTVAAYIGNNPA